MTQRLLAILLLVTISVTLSGCARQTGRKSTGIVTGKVTYKGEPLPGGSIHFFMADGPEFAFMIRSDGTFVAEVPAGPATIAVETESAKYKGSRAEMMKKWRKVAGPEYVHMKRETAPSEPFGPTIAYREIPERYSDPGQSGLTHDVVPGPQQRDFELD
jgi:hypothetical protein